MSKKARCSIPGKSRTLRASATRCAVHRGELVGAAEGELAQEQPFRCLRRFLPPPVSEWRAFLFPFPVRIARLTSQDQDIVSALSLDPPMV
jgi:hypothetical protein